MAGLEQRPLPREHVRVDGVHERAVEIEDQGKHPGRPPPPAGARPPPPPGARPRPPGGGGGAGGARPGGEGGRRARGKPGTRTSAYFPPAVTVTSPFTKSAPLVSSAIVLNAFVARSVR